MNADDGYVVIFVRSFIHPKTRKLVRRPDGGPMPLRIRASKLRKPDLKQ
jgi:hypothetical protein